MAERSPNFPSMSLPDAIDAIRLVYQREGRGKMPRLSAVKPLGYTSINGRSLSVLGALRAYGLLDGRGDDVRVSDDAITILNAPEDSQERREALVRAFEAPSSFALLRSKGDASPDTLRWHLIKSNFRDDAADKLIKVYLESKDLVNAGGAAYDSAASAETADPQPAPRGGLMSDWPTEARAEFERRLPPERRHTPQQAEGVAMGVHERVLQSGMLSKAASYRVIVSGPVGTAEIERLLKKLEMDKEILADPDPEFSDPETDGVDLA
jgi:hypothetical protein